MLLLMVRKDMAFTHIQYGVYSLFISIELHVYNGLFGTHVALIMRRLRRLCSYNHNESVQFISCSATIDDSYEVSLFHTPEKYACRK